MQKILLAFLFSLPVYLNAYTQSTADSIEFSTLLFDRFEPGTVLLKSGKVEKAPLNYNMNDQNIVFIDHEKYLVIEDLPSVDTVFIKDRKFITDGKIFFEVASSGPALGFYITYSCKTRPEITAGEKTGITPKVANEVSNTVSDVYTARTFKRRYQVEVIPHYWISLNRETFYKANSEKQFTRVFPSASASSIRNFIKENSISFKNKKDLIDLTRYCNEKLW